MCENEIMQIIEEISIILPLRLKDFREKAGLSLREVANRIYKSPSQISLWEKGVNPPSCIDLFKLCLVYNILFSELFPEICNEDKPIKQEIELYKKYRKADNEVKLTIQKILEYTEK